LGLKEEGMEYLEKILKRTGISSLITSIIFAILGIILIINPEGTIKFVSIILGAMFILVGLYKILNYIRNKGKYDFYNYDISYGIIAVILGVITICYSSQIGTIFRILIGLWIIYSAIIRISLSAKLKNISSNVWLYSLAIALIMGVCGIYIICNSGAIIVTLGIVVLIYSILDIIESIIFLGNVNKLV
jgi:uncharacterized membrane protein HdeD (DUF308 family)